MTTFTAACIQLRTGRSVEDNVAVACELIREAADNGADLIMTPEMTALMELGGERLFAAIVPQEEDRGLAAFRALASDLGKWLLIGSLAVRVGERRAANRSFAIAPDGTIAAYYDKMHMFDVDLDGGERYRESRNYVPGNRAVVAALPWGGLGLSVCYDLRFPALYRALAQHGATFLSVPAAFTRQTGEAHWHVLVRARAIENGAFVFAPAQGGRHENGRETYGHSLIVSPWGQVLAEGGTELGVVTAEIDPAEVDAARRRVPSLTHDRAISVDGPGADERAAS